MPSLPAPGTHRRCRSDLRAVAALLPLSLLLASCSTESSNNGGSPSPAANTTAANSPAPGTPATDSATGQPATAMFEKPRKANGPLSIKIVTNGISPFWDPMAAGMKRAAADLHCEADWAGPENSTVGEQKRIVEDALAKGVDGIAVSCIEAQAAVPIIDAALAKGVPVITFDADSPGSRRLAYIGTNNFKAGEAAGKEAVRLLPKGGKFVGFVGNLSAQNARERADGFKSAGKEHQIEVKEIFDDNKDKTRARRNVEDAISRYKDQVQGFLGLFSYNAPAIAQAVSNAGLRARYKIVTFDAEPVTLQELGKGNIDATVVQKPYDFGYLSTKLLYLINRKGWSGAKKELKVPDDGIYDTGVEVITPANVGEYRKKLEKLGVKSS